MSPDTFSEGAGGIKDSRVESLKEAWKGATSRDLEVFTSWVLRHTSEVFETRAPSLIKSVRAKLWQIKDHTKAGAQNLRAADSAIRRARRLRVCALLGDLPEAISCEEATQLGLKPVTETFDTDKEDEVVRLHSEFLAMPENDRFLVAEEQQVTIWRCLGGSVASKEGRG